MKVNVHSFQLSTSFKNVKMIVIVLLCTIIAGLVVFWWQKKTCKPHLFPPGPPRYPIIGSLFELRNPWFAKPSVFWGILQMQRKYGDTFGFYLGNLPTVVLTRYEDIKKVLNMEQSAARPPISGGQFRPGWKDLLETDPILNKDRSPGRVTRNGHF